MKPRQSLFSLFLGSTMSDKHLSIPENLKAAWSNLPESGKKRFCLKLYETDKLLFKSWIRRAGLDVEGFRPDILAQREHSISNERLDKAFLSYDDGRFEKNVLKLVLPVLDPELHFYCEKKYGEGAGNSNELFLSTLEYIRNKFAGSLFLNLYSETVSWYGLEWFEVPGAVLNEKEVEAVEAAENEPNYLKKKLEDIKTHVDTLNEELNKVGCARSIDKTFFLDSFNSALKLGEELRDHISQLCHQHNCSKSDWQELSELNSVIELLSQQIEDNKSKRRILEDLSSLLEDQKVIHRSNQRRDRLEQLKNDACQELKIKAAQETVADIANFQDKNAEEWLRVVLFTSGDALDILIRELSETLPALSVFLEEIEADNLAPIKMPDDEE
jgi:hypothetical protein